MKNYYTSETNDVPKAIITGRNRKLITLNTGSIINTIPASPPKAYASTCCAIYSYL